MAFIDKAMVVSKLVVYPMFASLSSELTNVDCTDPSGNEEPTLRGCTRRCGSQTNPALPAPAAGGGRGPGRGAQAGRGGAIQPHPRGATPHPHHLWHRQPQGSQVPLTDSRVCSTCFTRRASPQHTHAVQPVISHTIVMFPMPVERVTSSPKQ